MTGVDILATEEVACEFAFNWAAFWITAGIVFGIYLIIGIVFMFREKSFDKGMLLFIFAGLVFGPLMGMVAGFGIQTPTEYETQYKVTVSDEVSMTEFHEKYEIIETEGKIYTVREKDTNHDQ